MNNEIKKSGKQKSRTCGENKNTIWKREPLGERDPFGSPAARQVSDLDDGRDWNGEYCLIVLGGIRWWRGRMMMRTYISQEGLGSRKKEAVYEMVGLLLLGMSKGLS